MKKVLIANRGEITRRIIRSLKNLNIKTVAVYSDADRNAPHVHEADEAYHLGPAPSHESYLLGDKILDIAKSTNCDGIHPGYGFLSENESFARACAQKNIIFIGPGPEAIRVMGSKLESKQTVMTHDIPLVPGTEEAITDVEEAKRLASDIGFPILIKASAGGGGKGMRVVNNLEEFEDQMSMAKSEAKASFGDDAVFIEKYIASPRHIEIQILADNFGNVVHLFERECSIQRRHQKVIEEAPSVVLTPELREEMGQAAIRVAKSCNYSGVGTVEFLLDDKQKFYFLEMNTRLQVEHPVTELITGLDLVKEQVYVARGEKLRDELYNLGIKGHSIELRVYAENSMENFAPSIGVLHNYMEPSADLARVDSAYKADMEIPIYYDPMISKLIVHADNRDEAIAKMKEAIKNYNIEGVNTTLDFGRFVMDHPDFISGNIDTHFVQKDFSPAKYAQQYSRHMEAAAAFVCYLHEK